MNVLTQYGVSVGLAGGAFVQASFIPDVPQTLTINDLQGVFQRCVNAGVFPEPQDARTSRNVNVMVVYLDENTIIRDGDRQLNFEGANEVGFHEHFRTASGHQFYFSFVAYSPDIATQTMIASHEVAEMVTDPEFNAWTPDNGVHEIGDYCQNFTDAITVGSNIWSCRKSIVTSTGSALAR